MGKRGFPRVSCLQCHCRKVKCDRTTGSCSNCRRRNEQCTVASDDNSHPYIRPFPVQTTARSVSSSNSQASHNETPRASESGDSHVGTSFEPESLPALSNLGAIYDTEFLAMIASCLNLPLEMIDPVNPTSSTSDVAGDFERYIAIDMFFQRNSIVTDIVRPLQSLVIGIPREDYENVAWPSVLRKSIVCSALMDPSSASEIGNCDPKILLDNIKERIQILLAPYSANNVSLESICALLVMSEVWPHAPFFNESTSSVLNIDITSIEAICRVWSNLRNDLNSTWTSFPTFRLLDWYITLLDAMNAACDGRPPYLPVIPSTNSVASPTDSDASWIEAASNLASTARCIGMIAYTGEIHRSSNPARSILTSLEQWNSTWYQLTRGQPALATNSRVWTALAVLRDHCVLTLEAHVTVSNVDETNISGIMDFKIFGAMASSAWADVLNILECSLSKSATQFSPSAGISPLVIDISIGCLFWGLDQIRHHLQSGDSRREVMAYMTGSQRFVDILAKSLSHRPIPLARLRSLHDDLKSLTSS